jgi:hypothetical protein
MKYQGSHVRLDLLVGCGNGTQPRVLGSKSLLTDKVFHHTDTNI